MYKLIALAVTLCLFSSCRKFNEYVNKKYESDFSKDTDGWNAFFSDYHVGGEEFYELAYERTGLPDPLDNTVKALRINGSNHSDDLVSMVYRKFNGLKPNKQ